MDQADKLQRQARRRAERYAMELVADPVRLAEIKADETAVLNGHCPPADPDDLVEKRLAELGN